jgi:hypothetical protein
VLDHDADSVTDHDVVARGRCLRADGRCGHSLRGDAERRDEHRHDHGTGAAPSRNVLDGGVSMSSQQVPPWWNRRL